jgi:hypothetical protein
MRGAARYRRLLALSALFLLSPVMAAEKQTVCTITINSADEQQTFRRFLPADKYRFVELVERNRPDWLGAACQAKVACDVLVISGHHGEGSEGNVFFSESLEHGEHLPIEELERVSCSDSCPSLFAHLKEVYLFGCNTLNPQPQHTISDEIVRSLTREGKSADNAARIARLLGQTRGESSRDRMRLLFKDVPVIYGFSSVAPLGPVAGSILNRYFHNSGTGEIAKGRASSSLLRQFSQHNMVAARGIGDGDPLSPLRRDVCSFADDRLSVAQRLDEVHALLQRPVAESRLLLDRIERFAAKLDAPARQQPEVADALQRIARDDASRERYLAFARDADEFPTRARMIEVAHELDWLTPPQRREELVRMLGELLARKDIGAPNVDLACTLNKDGELDGALQRLETGSFAQDVAHSAVLACVGSDQARARVLEGLVSPDDADVRIAQAYLRQRPIADVGELRRVTQAIARMSAPEAQTRALDVLARHYVADRESVDTLKHLFSKTRSSSVQNAIAGVLIRADRSSVKSSDLLPTLRENRLRASPDGNMVDALIERLEKSS